MAAPKGNKFYLERLKSGRDKEYQPDEIIPTFLEYAEYVYDNPIEEEVIQKIKTSRDTEEIKHVKRKTMRVMSIGGFCVYAGITTQTFRNYEKDKDFFGVISRVRDFIENYQLEGASSNQLNPNVISRLLGLADKTDYTIREQPLIDDV